MFAIIYFINFLITRVGTTQQPTLTLSDTGRVFREADSLTYFCMIDKPAPDGRFSWTHLRNASGITAEYNITTHQMIPRITVLEGALSSRSKYSNLVISDTTPYDSGIISCLYTYRNYTLFVDRPACIASLPNLPKCSATSNWKRVFCNVNVKCPEDVTLKWFNVTSMEEFVGELTKSSTVVQSTVALERDITDYQCSLESELYPDIHFTCRPDLWNDRGPNDPKFYLNALDQTRKRNNYSTPSSYDEKLKLLCNMRTTSTSVTDFTINNLKSTSTSVTDFPINVSLGTSSPTVVCTCKNELIIVTIVYSTIMLAVILMFFVKHVQGKR